MTEPVDPIIRAQAVEKFYVQPDGNRIEVIAPVDLDVEPGKIITLLGPSGCGKSTLLRILTGLSKPSSGEVLWHGRPISSQNAGVAIVFQSFALFPWLTVLDNVEAPLEARGVPALERRKRALRILDTVGLDGFESAYPKELSGGMKQRVGFARALVVEPEVLSRQKGRPEALSHLSGQVFDLDYSALPPAELECLKFVLSDLGWEGYLGFVEEGMDNLHIGCSPGSREFFTSVFEEAVVVAA